LGGGRRYFTRVDQADLEYPDRNGYRKDGQDLVEEWISRYNDLEAKYVWNQTGFDEVDTETTDKLFGTRRETTGECDLRENFKTAQLETGEYKFGNTKQKLDLLELWKSETDCENQKYRKNCLVLYSYCVSKLHIR